MDPKDFIKIAHKHLVFRDDDAVPHDNRFQEALAAAERLAILSCPVLIQGHPGDGKGAIARAMAEYNPVCSYPKDPAGFAVFNCLADDLAKLKNLLGHSKGLQTTLFIDHLERQDDSTDDILHRLNEVLTSTGSTVPRVICASNSCLLPTKIDTHWAAVWCQSMKRDSFRPALRDFLKLFGEAQVYVPHISQRPWDIPLFVVFFLRGTDIRCISLNCLDLLCRRPWQRGMPNLQRTIEDAARLASSSGTIQFEHLEKALTAGEGRELLLEIKSPEPIKSRSEWLDPQWVAGESADRGKVGQVIGFAEAETILFDVAKMHEQFKSMLPCKAREPSAPAGRDGKTLAPEELDNEDPLYPQFLKKFMSKRARSGRIWAVRCYLHYHKSKYPKDPFAEGLTKLDKDIVKAAIKDAKGPLSPSTIEKTVLTLANIKEMGQYLKRCT